jgi:hypothetical protein
VIVHHKFDSVEVIEVIHPIPYLALACAYRTALEVNVSHCALVLNKAVICMARIGFVG